MHRSRPFSLRRVHVLIALAVAFGAVSATLPSAVSAKAGTPFWVTRISYLTDTLGVSDHLEAVARLDPAQQRALLTAVGKLGTAYDELMRESDPVVRRTDITLTDKQAAVSAMHYNQRLASAEASCYAQLRTALGPEAMGRLGNAADATWQWDVRQREIQNASETVRAMSVGALSGYIPAPYTVFATQFGINAGTPVNQVALPDRYAKFANWGTAKPGYPAGVYAVLIKNPANGKSTIARVWDCGPWNTDDNYWNANNDPVRRRRIYDYLPSGAALLPMGTPESVAAFRDGYNGGKDQSGRRVTQNAALDLGVDAAETAHWVMRSPWEKSVPYALGIGIRQNEYLQITPMWEANLALDAPVKVSAGPYFTGQRLSAAYCVKNVGTQPGTWDQFTFTLKSGAWSQNPTYQGPVTLGAGRTKTFVFSQIIRASGTLTGVARAKRIGSWGAVTTQTATIKVAKRTVDRIAGTDRYDTAVQMSRKAYPSTAAAIVIATGRTFPDALAGAALAHAEGGPLLLVGTGVSAGVHAEIARLKPSKVFVLGATGVISSAEATQIRTAWPSATMTRLAGNDRYGTAARVAAAVAAHNGGKVRDGMAIVATGKSFPDALAASVLSAEKGWPILLTNPSTLATAAKTAISQLGVKTTLLVGGTGVVSNGVASKLPSCTRIAGATRYDTAARVADYAAKKGLSYAYVGLTTGETFPDALAGGVFAAHVPGMMLITPPDDLPGAMWARLVAHRTVTAHLQAYGSTGAVSDEVLRNAENALR